MSKIKIHVNKNKVQLTKEVLPQHIPLAYVCAENKEYRVDIQEIKKPNSAEKVIPYQKFDGYEKVFFKSKVKNPSRFEDLYPVDSKEYLQRIENHYLFMPKNCSKFEPLHFSYKILGKRQWQYANTEIYNMKIGCISKKDFYVKNLSSIFGDAGDRHIVPKNVWVNNKDISASSLESGVMTEKDFLFIETTDGSKMSANDQPIPYDDLLNAHTNIWLSYPDIKSLEIGVAKLKNTILYHDPIELNKNTFLASEIPIAHLPSGGIPVEFFTTQALGCLVFHYPNKGFIIASSEAFILNAQENHRFIYDVLMQIFLQSYTISKSYYSFISDYPIDYIIKNFKAVPFDTFRSEKPYYELLGSRYKEDFTLIDIVFSSDQVQIIDSKDYLYFKKIGEKTDPVKPANSYAIFLETNDIAYVDEWLYMIDTPIPTEWELQTENILLKIGNFCNSHILNMETSHLLLSLTETVNYEKHYLSNVEYLIVHRQGILKAVLKDDVQNDDVVLLKVRIHLVDAPVSLIDMRQRGGGLPANKKDNYNLFDVGYNLGKQFRLGGSYIVYLPEKVKPYHERIVEALKKYGVADHHYNIVYKNREDDLFDS